MTNNQGVQPKAASATDQTEFEVWIADRYIEKTGVDRDTAAEFAAAFFEVTADGAVLTFGDDEYAWTISDANDIADEDMSCWESE